MLEIAVSGINSLPASLFPVGHSHWKNSLIWGIGLENITISGPGLIYGKGLTREESRLPGVGNKAISLKECRNVTLKDLSMLHCGHFALLATGIDNLTILNLKVDTNRDGFDIDCCRNVRISQCTVNSPWDDAIVLKASYGLGRFQDTENVTISDCYVSGYDKGSVLDGTWQLDEPQAPDHGYRTGRIKLGTESSGGFRNIAITNCIFEHCRGLALETVDGGHLEDIVINNITMRNIVNAPIFLRLGARMRSPGKQIKSYYSFFKIDIVIEYIKQIFFGEICRRACFKCSGHVKSSSFVNTADYSHVNKACMSILVAGFIMNTCRINFFNSLIKTSFSESC